MSPYWRRVIDDLKNGENIAVSAAVVLALVIAVVIALKGDLIGAAALVVLALMGGAVLNLFHQLKVMPERLRQVSQYAAAGITLESREGFGIPLPALLKDARQVDIFGLSL